ncbi:MAG: hypothetical protein ALECFALPRED_000915 [Alectoria fallacina]|uniref:Uncharacterized protein n=1 Tax=Alectoria fallacina TaxID=1903189 RepID=A0A8H3JAL6_9LECA|nr:MAG: hypothetical protein ALECFALPRED_000915 [Alectoria fallacina]
MSIRSTSSLGLTAFNRPLSILARARNVPPTRAASARLGLYIHTPPPIKPFHSSIHQLQQTPDKPTPSPQPTTAPTPPPPSSSSPGKPSPQGQAPTDREMEPFIPGFSKMGVDIKLQQLQLLRSDLETETQRNDPKWRAGAYEAVTEALARKEQEIRDSDTWWRQAFRSIAWGPTILVNAIIALFFW